MSELELLLLGDAKETLATLADDSVDALVTDPPAGIGFMGKDWDDYRRSHNQADVGRDNVFGRTSRVAPEVGRARDGFMAAVRPIFEECLRVLKPGAHGLVWALPRTSHWTATALEDAGFEVRDRIAHLFGTGFPKSLDVSKAIDKAAGAEREIVGRRTDGRYAYEFNGTANRPTGAAAGSQDADRIGGFVSDKAVITAPATDAAREWDGWGTALKPACEDWWLVRKPLVGTVAANVLSHGTGALNIDGCRIAGAQGDGHWSGDDGSDASSRPGYDGGFTKGGERAPSGRWPANLVLSHTDDCEPAGTLKIKSGVAGADGRGFRTEYVGGEAKDWSQRVPATFNGPDGAETVEAWNCAPDCPVRMLDEQSGDTTSSDRPRFNAARPDVFFGQCDRVDRVTGGYSDRGGASRFFYCAKPSRRERDLGCESLPAATGGEATGRVDGSAGTNSPRAGAGRTGGARNVHPTVKAVNLMRWLCRLITPPGGIVLDPFMGSGSTGLACQREALRFIGIERDPAYFDIAKARLGHGAPAELTLLGEAA